MFGKVGRFCDRLLLGLAQSSQLVCVCYLSIAIIFTMIAFALGLHDVRFDGNVAGGMVTGLAEGVSKQVGYVWAPNWALTSIVLVPLAVYNLLGARAAAENILPQLLERGMIQRTRDGDLDIDELNRNWRRSSASWSTISLAWVFIVGIFILGADFHPVVGKWLASPDFAQNAIKGLSINHSDYEFDWSIAALYPGQETPVIANYAFSLGAYLLVPIVGAGLIFGVFLWFVSISNFFSYGQMLQNGYVIVPDLESADERRGFEIFEPVFDNLIRAGLVTAIMALAMHFQNVFLRVPDDETILHMLFSGTATTASAMLKGNFEPMLTYLSSMDKVLQIDPHELSLQTYVTALTNLLVFSVILGLMWRWLRKLALGGQQYLSRHGDLNEDQEDALIEMDIWPVGWLTPVGVTMLIGVTLGAMYFVNLLPLILLAGMIKFATGQISSSILSAKKSKLARRRRRIRGKDKDET